MGQGPEPLSYIEPQTKVIRAMGQGPRAPSLGRAVLQRRDGFRLQERSDRPQGWPSSCMHKAVDVRTPRQAANPPPLCTQAP